MRRQLGYIEQIFEFTVDIRQFVARCCLSIQIDIARAQLMHAPIRSHDWTCNEACVVYVSPIGSSGALAQA
jgi:hypothetical protein